MVTQLHLTLCDGFRVTLGQNEIVLRQAASRQLLAHLALHPKMAETRPRLATLLWENSDEVRARRNFRQLLYAMRAELGNKWHGLTTTRESVTLESKSVKTDVGEVLMLLKSGKVPEVLIKISSYPSHLLSDLPSHGELFSSWRALAQRDLETQIRTHLDRIAAGGEPMEQERAAQAMLSLDRADEAASRLLMEMAVSRGNIGRALGIYADLWAHLDHEYGMEPSAQTQDLIAQIKMQTPDAPKQQASSRASSTRFSIGIPPATLLEPDAQTQTTANLFRSELMMRLLSFRELSVLDAFFTNEPTDYQLALVFAGTGKQTTVSARLTRMTDGTVVWGKPLGKVLPHWWIHQTDIAGQVAAACSASISRAQLALISERASEPGVIDSWILGQTYMLELRPDWWKKSEKAYKTCIARDAGFSMGYSSLSQLYHTHHLVCPGVMPDPRTFAESKILANRAIAMDPVDSRAHLCRAWSSSLLREFEQAAASFALARGCNENDPWTQISSALGAAFGGDQSLANKKAADYLNKSWPTTLPQWGFHATIRFLDGNDEGCIQAANNAGESILNIPAWKAAACWHLGRKDEARSAWSAFENSAREIWEVEEPPTTDAILRWFLSCFPIRTDAQFDRLKSGVTGAANS